MLNYPQSEIIADPVASQQSSQGIALRRQKLEGKDAPRRRGHLWCDVSRGFDQVVVHGSRVRTRRSWTWSAMRCSAMLCAPVAAPASLPLRRRTCLSLSRRLTPVRYIPQNWPVEMEVFQPYTRGRTDIYVHHIQAAQGSPITLNWADMGPYINAVL